MWLHQGILLHFFRYLTYILIHKLPWPELNWPPLIGEILFCNVIWPPPGFCEELMLKMRRDKVKQVTV